MAIWVILLALLIVASFVGTRQLNKLQHASNERLTLELQLIQEQHQLAQLQSRSKRKKRKVSVPEQDEEGVSDVSGD